LNETNNEKINFGDKVFASFDKLEDGAKRLRWNLSS
jgi:hypothetical protein